MQNRRSDTVAHGSFEQIEAAVRETERGRWFLDEYARRHGGPDTRELLSSIRRIERALGSHAGFSPDLAGLADQLIEARKAIPEIMREGGRLAAETLMATDVLESVTELPAATLATSGSRMALIAEVERLKALAGQQREVYARLAECAARFEALEAELLRGIRLPQGTPANAAAGPEAAADYFAEDSELFANPAPAAEIAPPPAQPSLKLVASDGEPTAAAAQDPAPETAKDSALFSSTLAAGERRRIVILRGNGQPPVPPTDETGGLTA